MAGTRVHRGSSASGRGCVGRWGGEEPLPCHRHCNRVVGATRKACLWPTLHPPPHPAVTAGWAAAYIALPWLFTLLWTALLFYQARVFVVAGTVAQW